ncbi:MAG: alpha-amylase family glycosyl hydrolase, partial [Gemmatimonadota bacterium]
SKAHLVAVFERMEREIPDRRYATLLRNHDQTRTMTELGGDVDRARVAATLLLTLPGTPFVYYGEEIGMTASKSRGDPRLRTPMHWSVEHGVGFTGGTPWEPLRPDSFTANVEVLDPEPGSLLNHYRRMIRLRKANPALAGGDFVNLETGRDDVLAFLRRSGDQTALVLVNLGTEPAADIVVRAAGPGLPAGRYEVRALDGGASAPAITAEDGPAPWSPATALPSLSGRVFELVPGA